MLTPHWSGIRASLQQVQGASRMLFDISRRLRALRDHTVCTLERGGHHPHLTDAKAVAAEIVPWLRRVAARKGGALPEVEARGGKGPKSML